MRVACVCPAQVLDYVGGRLEQLIQDTGVPPELGEGASAATIGTHTHTHTCARVSIAYQPTRLVLATSGRSCHPFA